MVLIVTAVFCAFLKIAVLGLLVAPTARLPNERLAGVSLVCAKAEEPAAARNERDTTVLQSSFVL